MVLERRAANVEEEQEGLRSQIAKLVEQVAALSEELSTVLDVNKQLEMLNMQLQKQHAFDTLMPPPASKPPAAPTATASTNNAELPSSSPPSPPSRRGKELRKMNKSPVKKKAGVKKAKAHKAGGKGKKSAYKKTNAAKANAKVAMEKKKAKPNGKKAVVSDAVNDNLVPSFSDDSGDLKSPMNSPFLCGFLFCEF